MLRSVELQKFIIVDQITAYNASNACIKVFLSLPLVPNKIQITIDDRHQVIIIKQLTTLSSISNFFSNTVIWYIYKTIQLVTEERFSINMARNCNMLLVDAFKIIKTSKTEYYTLNFFISGTCIPAGDFLTKILLSNKFTCLRADLVNQRQGVLHSNWILVMRSHEKVATLSQLNRKCLFHSQVLEIASIYPVTTIKANVLAIPNQQPAMHSNTKKKSSACVCVY